MLDINVHVVILRHVVVPHARKQLAPRIVLRCYSLRREVLVRGALAAMAAGLAPQDEVQLRGNKLGVALAS